MGKWEVFFLFYSKFPLFSGSFLLIDWSLKTISVLCYLKIPSIIKKIPNSCYAFLGVWIESWFLLAGSLGTGWCWPIMHHRTYRHFWYSLPYVDRGSLWISIYTLWILSVTSLTLCCQSTLFGSSLLIAHRRPSGTMTLRCTCTGGLTLWWQSEFSSGRNFKSCWPTLKFHLEMRGWRGNFYPQLTLTV